MASDLQFLPTATVTNLPTDQNAERSDIALEAVILGKPASDEVPTAAWWFLAECLEHSVVIRREEETGATNRPAAVNGTMRQARLAAREALDELDGLRRGDTTRTGVNDTRRSWADTPSLHVTVRELARLIVTHRTTTRDDLCRAIHVHLDALWLVDHRA